MEKSSFSLASPRHRFGGIALDIGIAALTGGLGWFIWLLIVMRKGQTPGKQILKMRVYDATTGLPLKWGKTFVRQLGIILLLNIAINIGLVGFIQYEFGIYIGQVTSGLFLILYVTDALWIFKDGKNQRLIDSYLKTQVLNESPSR